MKKIMIITAAICLVLISFILYSTKQNTESNKALISGSENQNTSQPSPSNSSVTAINKKTDNLINIAVDPNVHNGGYVYEGENATYLSLDQAILKIDDSASAPTRIADVVSKYLTFSEGEFYYSNLSDQERLYKIKSDGSDNMQWYDRSAKELYHLDNLFYFINTQQNDVIYRYSNDAVIEDKLNNEPSESMTVTPEGIYYAGDSGFLTKVNLDGSSRQVLNKTAVSYINVTEKYIYFINRNDKKIYKIGKEGGEQTIVSNDEAESMNISNGWIYYTNKGIYKEKSDGSEKALVTDYDAKNISVTSQWIYYTDSTMKQTFRISKVDGEPQEITLKGRHLEMNHFQPAVATDETKEAGKKIVRESLINSSIAKDEGYIDGVTSIDFSYVDKDGRFVYQVYNVYDNGTNTLNWFYVNVETGTFNTMF